MLLRISLVVAILAGVAALYFSHFKVAERINTLTTDLQTAQTAKQTADEAQRKAQAEAKKAKEEATKATQQLAETTAGLQEKTVRLNEQMKRAGQLSEELNTITKERNEARQALAAYEAANVKPEELKALRDLLIKTTAERDAFIAEITRITAQFCFEISIDFKPN